MRQLIWKEWHEQAWKLILGCIVVSAFAAIGLRTRIIPDEEMIEWVCVPFAALLPLFATTGLVPTERGDGSFESLRAMPIRLGKIMLVEALTGALLCVVPFLAATAASIAVAGGREMSSATLFEIYGRSTLTALTLFVWMFASTIRLPTDSRAAMVAIGILMCWALLAVAIRVANIALLSTISPFSFLLNRPSLDDSRHSLPSFALNFAIELLIAAALLLLAGWGIGQDVQAGD